MKEKGKGKGREVGENGSEEKGKGEWVVVLEGEKRGRKQSKEDQPLDTAEVIVSTEDEHEKRYYTVIICGGFISVNST